MARPVFLLTDFGTRDPSAGQVRAVLAAIAPEAPVYDLTHEVEPFAVDEGAWLLETSLAVLPEDAVVLAVVDPGVGTSRRAVAVDRGARSFAGPDNGLLSAAVRGCGESTPASMHEVTRLPALLVALGQADAAHRAAGPSTTFHGRDVFAPAAALLSLGVLAADLGHDVADPVLLPPFGALPGPGGVLRGHVVHIDRYGNAITTVPASALPPAFTAEIGGHTITRTAATFDAVPPGEAAAYTDSSGYLAFAARQASAAMLLGVGRGAAVEVRPR